MNRKAQTALEYLLILGTVMVIVLTGWKVFLPRVQNSSDLYFNRVNYGIAGKGPRCGDGNCIAPENPESCCVDCPPGGGSCAN
jgi:hypothetical protein